MTVQVEPVVEDTAELIAHLRANIAALVDEKYVLQTENAKLKAANTRLGEAAKALIVEKGDLQRQLAARADMGIQQNQPDTFKEMKEPSCICKFG